ncbi:MAG: PTS system mannose/fructose/sorbose family transporter subunit IID [Erysipelotrichaceae bacterium]|nr:PTS system mannose/fructose/sorbose family transporter subunit IID [Erysipelotrichaceae bacterium]
MAKNNLTKEDKKVMWDLFFRSNLIMASNNSVVMGGHGVLYTVAPYLEEFYKDDDEERKAAFKRHSTYYNTNPYTGAIVWVLIYILEKKRSMDRNAVSAEAIQNMKIALMGPLAAIGDTIFQGTLGNIIAALVMGLAQEGNFIAPILYLAIFLLLFGGGKWLCLSLTYTKGESFVTDLLETDMFDRLEDVISIVGLIMMGSLTASTVNFSFNWVITVSGVSMNVQTALLDALLPGVMPLIILFTCFHCLNKNIAPVYIIYGIMIVCVLLAYIGLL